MREHTTKDLEMAGLYALGLLEGVELETFEKHLFACPICANTVDQDRQTASLLSLAAPEADAPPGFKERVLRAGAAETSSRVAQEERTREPVRATWLPRLGFALPAAVVAVLVIVAVVIAGREAYSNQVVLASSLQGNVTSGGATVLVRRSGAAELQLQGLANPAPGEVYQAWVIPPGADPIPAGTSSTGNGTIKLDRSVDGTTVAVTVEPAPGSPKPTTSPILAASVGA